MRKKSDPVLDEVDDQPRDDDRDERQPDGGDDVRRRPAAGVHGDALRLYLGRDLGLLNQLGKGPEGPFPRVMCSRAIRALIP